MSEYNKWIDRDITKDNVDALVSQWRDEGIRCRYVRFSNGIAVLDFNEISKHKYNGGQYEDNRQIQN